MKDLSRSFLTLAGLLLVAGCGRDSSTQRTEDTIALEQALTHTTGWHTHGTKIYPPTSVHGPDGALDASELPFRIEAISWYGFETRDGVAHGLWNEDYTTLVDLIAQNGFNTIRIPFSNAMWVDTAAVRSGSVSACTLCQGKTPKQVLALIIDYAASQGLKVILDNHRSTAGNSAESSGLWYTPEFPESAWIQHWRDIQAWVNAAPWTDAVVGYELRNEPHTLSRGKNSGYLNGSTWGSGDGISGPNPNPFAPGCVADSSCHDWRLAAQRVGTLMIGDAESNADWNRPLLIVSGVGEYPKDGTLPSDNDTDNGWWGGMLAGVNGNSTNDGAPIVFNLGWDPVAGLQAPVNGQLVYTAHDYGPDEYQQAWFNSSTCYASGCSGDSLVELWYRMWGFVTDDINPLSSGPYPWDNTGNAPGYSGYSRAPLLVGEFGTGNANSDLSSTVNGSQGQWFASLVELIRDSSDAGSDATGLPASGRGIFDLSWSYWALNGNDSYGLLDSSFAGVVNPAKLSALCAIQSAGCASCGDSVCGVGEDCASCASDCGACPYCGDGACDANESCDTCAGDCGGCFCNNGSCDADEDCFSCSADCGTCSSGSGCVVDDGVCGPGEDCTTCGDCAGVTKGKPSDRWCCGDGNAVPQEGDGSICDGNY